MSYKRTVRCSYCYGTGHNKSGCPQYKAKIEEWRAGHHARHRRSIRQEEGPKRREPRPASAPTVERQAILGLDAPK